VAEQIGDGGAAGLKSTVTTAVNDLLAPIRARRAEYERNPSYLRQVLRDGNERANELAAVTLAEVQAAMGMRY
jgi:tryptophanyl-tRNA synthetase